MLRSEVEGYSGSQGRRSRAVWGTLYVSSGRGFPDTRGEFDIWDTDEMGRGSSLG